MVTPSDHGSKMPGNGNAVGAFHRRRVELLLAFALLTRFPLPRFVVPTGVTSAQATWAYPLAGLAVGAVGGVVLVAASAVTPSTVSTVLAIAATVLATGCLHEDAMADFADGVGGGRTRARKLEIMRDSRIGAYGVVTIALVLALKVVAISELALQLGAIDAAVALAGVTALGRALVVLPYLVLSEAREDGLAVATGRPTVGVCCVAVVIGAALALPALPSVWQFAWVILGATAGAGVVTWFAFRHLRGYTGDVLGATILAAETVALVLLASPAIAIVG